MRRYIAVRKLEQSAVGRQRFDFRDVESRSFDLTTFEGVGQGFLVDDGSACRVDQQRRGLHPLERVGIEQVAGLVGRRGVDGDAVRLGGPPSARRTGRRRSA